MGYEDVETLTFNNTMSIFTREEPLGDYAVTIKTPMAYRLAIKHVDIGLSMKQTSLAIQAAKEAVNVSNSTGMNQAKVDAFDRVQISPNYQTIASVLRPFWAFSDRSGCIYMPRHVLCRHSSSVCLATRAF